nr:MAG TPA: hypothetical protein [Caudoviricetes sp.]
MADACREIIAEKTKYRKRKGNTAMETINIYIKNGAELKVKNYDVGKSGG